MLQDIHQASLVQRYPLGLRYAVGERVYRYARAGGTLVPDMGVKNALTQHIGPTRAIAVALAGASTIDLTVGATDGVAGNGAIAANELVGGHIVIFCAGLTAAINRGIKRNTAVSAPGGAMTVTLDKPLSITLPIGSTGECIASLYRNVQNDVIGWHPVVGLPTLAATVNQYLWLQTWGPIWMAAQLTVGVGVNNMQVVFRADGSLGMHDPVVVDGQYAQHAGYVMADMPAGAQGAPFVYLQIAP